MLPIGFIIFEDARCRQFQLFWFLAYGRILPAISLTPIRENRFMTSGLSSSANRVQDFLTTRGFSFEVQELPSSTRTAQEAADSIGWQFKTN